MKRRTIKKSILVPLVLVSIVLSSVFVLSVYNDLEKELTDRLSADTESVRALLANKISSDTRLIGAVLDSLIRDQKLKAAMKAKDRMALLILSRELFKNLHSNHRLSHLYFTGPDRINILRAHRPESYGDKINRVTTLQAERTGKETFGVELGQFETLTLRVVMPWYDGHDLIGYLELGEDFGQLIGETASIIGLDICLFIPKKGLNRSFWESGMRMLGRIPQWDQFGSSVLAYQSQKFPIGSVYKNFPKWRDVPANTLLKLHSSSHDYYAGFVNFMGANGHPVGDILIVRDVTQAKTRVRDLLVFVGCILLFVFGSLFVLFYVITDRVVQQIDVAEKELRCVNDDLEQRVEQRTKQLETANADLKNEISARVQAEEELSRANELKRTLLDSLPHAAMLIDGNFRVLIANGFATNMGAQVGQYCWKTFCLSEYLRNTMGIIDSPLEDKAGGSPQQAVGRCHGCLLEEAIGDSNHKARSLVVEARGGSWEIRWIAVSGSVCLCYVTDVTEQKTAESRILESLNRQQMLLREVHHRTKNNMQVITSLLSLQSAQINDKATLDLFNDTKDRIRSMALVHEMLYQAEDLSKIDLKSYLEKLATNLLHSHAGSLRNVRLCLESESIPISIDSALPCGLIINEIVSNSLKHAFPDSREGEIRIRTSRAHDGGIEIMIGDNGIGVSDGFDIRESSSLGLKLITNLAEQQLRGKLKITSQQGLTYSLVFNEHERTPRI